jgi:hypothetical protein
LDKYRSPNSATVRHRARVVMHSGAEDDGPASGGVSFKQAAAAPATPRQRLEREHGGWRRPAKVPRPCTYAIGEAGKRTRQPSPASG